jgi:anhydro-N-acetylmuramic acid kinase
VTSAELGLDPDAKEAVAFAILGYETLRGVPSNVPSATGATRPAVQGKVCWP